MMIRLLSILRAALVCIIAMSLAACDSRSRDKGMDQLSDDVEQAISLAKQKVADLSPHSQKLEKAASGEVEKLFSYEYTVKDLDASLSLPQLQAELDMLGMERWDCFNIQNMNAQLRVFCKRRPKTYLRYLVPDLL